MQLKAKEGNKAQLDIKGPEHSLPSAVRDARNLAVSARAIAAYLLLAEIQQKVPISVISVLSMDVADPWVPCNSYSK